MAASPVLDQANLEALRESMIDTVARSEAHFRHQQRGEADLTYTEKFTIAEETLLGKPDIFLSRFGRFLMEHHLIYFSQLENDYSVSFYVNDVKKHLNDKKSKTQIRNRRYEAMQELCKKGEYFGDDEMKRRDPLLYEQMVGQFLSEDEIHAQVDKCEASFANILMKHIQVQHNNELYSHQKDVEHKQMEEDDLDDDKDKRTRPEDLDSDESELESETEMENDTLDDLEKKRLREEFTSIMQQRFLNGEDTDFDYEAVDGNAEFDSVEIRTQDEQEKYFDDDDDDCEPTSDKNVTEMISCDDDFHEPGAPT